MSINLIRMFAVPLTAGLLASVACAQPGGDGSEASVEATHLAGNVYLLSGGSGANSSALVGDAGVVLVDSKTDTASAEGILTALAGLTGGDVRYLINTHEHPDHTGGNEIFGERGATIVGLEGVREVLAAGQRGGPPAPAVALPVMTIGSGRGMTLRRYGETIEILDMPDAHTASNALVRYVDANVYHLGDLYTRTRYPVIAGGTVQGFIESVDQLLEMSDADSKFIPGVGPVGDRNDLMRYRNMLVTVRDRVADLVGQGMSLEEVAAANPTAGFDATYGDPGRLFLPPVYQEFNGGGPQ